MSATSAPSRRRRGRERNPDREPLPRSAWTRLAACTAAAALLQLDGTVITVALPNVSRSLHVSSSSTAVILSAYFLAYALLLFPGGHLVDKLGARRVALIGLMIFAVGAAAGAPTAMQYGGRSLVTTELAPRNVRVPMLAMIEHLVVVVT